MRWLDKRPRKKTAVAFVAVLSPTSFAKYWTLGREELSVCSNADAARLVGTIKAASVGGLFHFGFSVRGKSTNRKSGFASLISDKATSIFSKLWRCRPRGQRLFEFFAR